MEATKQLIGKTELIGKTASFTKGDCGIPFTLSISDVLDIKDLRNNPDYAAMKAMGNLIFGVRGILLTPRSEVTGDAEKDIKILPVYLDTTILIESNK
jgi:hypothetical protein